MAGNRNLNDAAKAKKDKFYTQLADIERELYRYRDFFRGKTILCNCDDSFESNFFKYFAKEFNALGIKKLITTVYADSPVAGMEISLFDIPKIDNSKVFMCVAEELQDWNGDGRQDLADVEYAIRNGLYPCKTLHGDNKYCAGDFRSQECIELLKQADIVITNPPFSLFREYVAQLIQYDKKFVIVGNINCITYKEIFPLIKDNKVWLGYGMGRAISGFVVPNDYELYGTEARINERGQRIISTNQGLWLTNLPIKKRFADIPLYKNYNPAEYPKYDNYDAIEVSKTAEIPYDYYGVMGVPITFLDKYNPDQFEILGHTHSGDRTEITESLRTDEKNRHRPFINGKQLYERILIRRRQS